MTGQRSALLLLLSLQLTAAFFPTRHLRSLVEKRNSCDITSCLTTFMDHGYGSPYDGFMASLKQSEVFESLCRDFATLNVCIKGKLKSCPAVDNRTQISIDGLRGLEGWMCSDEGRQAVLSEPAGCWGNPEVEAAFVTCAEEGGPNDLCEDLQVYRDCVRSEYGSRCSPTAVAYVEGIIYYFQKPIVDSYMGGCDQEAPTLPN